MHNTKISASVMCADLLHLGSDLQILAEKGFDYLHYDVMDGHFVPEVGLGLSLLERITRSQHLPVDVHLMVTDPERLIDPLVSAGVSLITIHSEIEAPLPTVLRKIRRSGRKTGLAVKRETPLSSIVPFLEDLDMVLLMAYAPGVRHQGARAGFEHRITELCRLLEANGRDRIDVAVDGGITEEHMKQYRRAGASFLVLGTAGLFIPGTRLAEQAERVRHITRERIGV